MLLPENKCIEHAGCSEGGGPCVVESGITCSQWSSHVAYPNFSHQISALGLCESALTPPAGTSLLRGVAPSFAAGAGTVGTGCIASGRSPRSRRRCGCACAGGAHRARPCGRRPRPRCQPPAAASFQPRVPFCSSSRAEKSGTSSGRWPPVKVPPLGVVSRLLTSLIPLYPSSRMPPISLTSSIGGGTASARHAARMPDCTPGLHAPLAASQAVVPRPARRLTVLDLEVQHLAQPRDEALHRGRRHAPGPSRRCRPCRRAHSRHTA